MRRSTTAIAGTRGRSGARQRVARGRRALGPGATSTATGSGQTVAIIDWRNDPTIASDLGVFDSHYRLATCTIANGCLNVLDQNGAASPPPPDEGGAGEISLDVETVHAVCQKCRIDMIEVDDSSNPSVETGVNEAVKLGATEVSTSYGGPDPAGGPSAADKAAYNHRGVVITASTGDDGYDSYDWWIKTPSGGPAANPTAPNFPAELATVVSVGGTSLASPLIAAMFALAGGSHGTAYPALTLYGHLGKASLYDVTVCA
ncbi:MAG: hypothetical protein M0Z69_15470 [Actinomycetota bacterium]|nr:hypothetical protein [Actinomycetota bacterium]